MLNVTPDHTVRVADLPLFEDHRDPFDRMLVAQAFVAGLLLVTADSRIQHHRTDYAVETLWAGV